MRYSRSSNIWIDFNSYPSLFLRWQSTTIAFFNLQRCRTALLTEFPTMSPCHQRRSMFKATSCPTRNVHQRSLRNERRNHHGTPTTPMTDLPLAEADLPDITRIVLEKVSIMSREFTFHTEDRRQNDLRWRCLGRSRSPDSSSSHASNGTGRSCEDCGGCRFYQDRFGPGFMDSFGPCGCNCHKWAYT